MQKQDDRLGGKMAGKSKFDYEVENFISAFQKYKNKKIVLYGTGRMTVTLVSRIKDFQIIGLCDRDDCLRGKEIYGLPVLGREEAEKKADLVIINTSATYWETIYRRIKDWKIPIYFCNGEIAKEKIYEETDAPCWDRGYRELRKLIDGQDIISFDIFDTLVMRKVMLPMDVFRLTEIRLDKEKQCKTDFLATRKEASTFLTEPTLDEIYIKMSELTGKPQEEMEGWKKIELDTEEKLLILREDMVRLCREALAEKEVYFVSDMYYPSEVLQMILWKVCGIRVDKGQIIVSCEQKKTKQEGNLWEYFKNNIVGKKKALHIGDNEISDIQKARDYDIAAYHIMGAGRMLQKSSIKAIGSTIESLYSSLAMGLICARIFNSPFALNKTKGKIEFSDEKEAGYVLLGSLLYSFMVWLVGKVKNTGIGKLAFFAREGYLLIPIYNYLNMLAKDNTLPEAVYLEISRRTVWNASISGEKDIYEIAEFPYMGTVRMLLQERFGISISENELIGAGLEEVWGENGNAEEILKPFKEIILERSMKEKEGYQTYMADLGLGEKYAVVDSQFYGSTQYYLGKMLNKRLTGYYLCACMEQDNRYLGKNEMYGCFQGDTKTNAKDTNVHKQAQFLEAFFTSPEGMLEYIDSSGRKYAKKMKNQQNFSIRLDMMEGIKEFIGQMFSIQKDLNLGQTDNMWSDTLFGCLMDGGIIPSEEMKKSFWFDNYVTGGREMPIWE